MNFDKVLEQGKEHYTKAPAAVIQDVLDMLEDYIIRYRLTEEEGRVLLGRMMGVEMAIKAQSAPPPPDF